MFSRLEWPAGRSKRIFTKRVAAGKCIFSATRRLQTDSSKIPLPVTSPSREKANQPDPQVWLICNTKNNYFLYYCQSEAETILNRHVSVRFHKILRRDFTVLAEHLFQHLHHAVFPVGRCQKRHLRPQRSAIKKPYFAVVSISASL